MEAAWAPDDFDGIVAGDPASPAGWRRSPTRGTPSATAARRRLDGDPPTGQADGNAPRHPRRVDGLDGLKDGILMDPRACHFDVEQHRVQGWRRRARLPERRSRWRRPRRPTTGRATARASGFIQAARCSAPSIMGDDARRAQPGDRLVALPGALAQPAARLQLPRLQLRHRPAEDRGGAAPHGPAAAGRGVSDLTRIRAARRQADPLPRLGGRRRLADEHPRLLFAGRPPPGRHGPGHPRLVPVFSWCPACSSPPRRRCAQHRDFMPAIMAWLEKGCAPDGVVATQSDPTGHVVRQRPLYA